MSGCIGTAVWHSARNPTFCETFEKKPTEEPEILNSNNKKNLRRA